jgi:hypothetical protein
VRTLAAAGVCIALAGCATQEQAEVVKPEDVPGQIVRLLPPNLPDRAGWAADIYAAFATQGITPSPQNLCAVLAVTEQESSFRADPSVPGLAEIAWREIDDRADRAGVPKFAVRAALQLPSSDGRSFAGRIDAVKTERELSDIYEDFIGRVPFGRTLLENSNPVRTGGPMQVNVAFARAQAAEKRYPYAIVDSIRDEVFTRRGGMYFGIAHLLDYPASYDRDIYRFADYNAGRYASRNAAFQNALAIATGRKLALDGDLVPANGSAGETEAAALSAAQALDMSASEIRRDLKLENREGFESTPLYRKVFALAEARHGKAAPRAVLPVIELHTPKTTRRLTTRWFAERVAARQKRCLARSRP